MDQIIEMLPSVPFGELNYCYEGIAYQREMNCLVPYDESYFQCYVHLEDTEIANKINQCRTSITEKYCNKIIDMGIGSGEFIKKSKIPVLGYDVNEVAIKWLKEKEIFVDPYENIPDDVDGLSFWDVLEHIPEPSVILSKVPSGKYVFISIPIFDDVLKVRQSKHYKPNEHLYYFSSMGMIVFMDIQGFDLVEISDGETRAGRESILTFVFKKD